VAPLSWGSFEVIVNERFADMVSWMVRSARRRLYFSAYVVSRHMYWVLRELAVREREGVDVRVLVDGGGASSRRYNSGAAEAARAWGLRGFALSKRFNHVKLYIADDYVAVGSHNLTAHSPHSYEVTVMVRSGPLADALSEVFEDLYRGADPEDRVVEVAGYRVLVDTGVIRLVRELLEGGGPAYIASYVASLSRAAEPVYRELERKAASGEEAVVVLDGYNRHAPEERYNLGVARRLASAGVDARLSRPLLHAKLYIVGDYVVVGSQNLTSSSAAGRHELSVAVENRAMARAMAHLVKSIPYWRP